MSHRLQSSWRRSNWLDISGPSTFSPIMNSHWIPIEFPLTLVWKYNLYPRRVVHIRNWSGCADPQSFHPFSGPSLSLDLRHHDNSGRVVTLAQLEVQSTAGFRSVHVYCTCISLSSRKGQLRCSTTQNDDTLSSHSPSVECKTTPTLVLCHLYWSILDWVSRWPPVN